jgi:hypothetical protein
MEFATLRSFIGGALALMLALSIPARAAPPADAGRPVVYEGTVAVAVEDDFARGRATKRYFLDEQTLGERIELKVSEAQGRLLKTGARIRVRGVAAGGVLAADATGDGVTVLADAVAAVPVTARKAVVMLVDITDSTSAVSRISADCDGALAKSSNIMFGTAASVDTCYKDSSYGALGMGGSVYPGGTLDVVRVSVTEAATTGGTCNYSAWGSAADKAAAAAGITLSNYQHRVYVLPSNVGCTWAGLAYVGCGNSCQAWVKAYSGQVCGYNDAYAHELGHNLGMWHASTDTNNDGTLDCEYCDNSDFMGYAMSNLRTQNGPHKVQMGWASGTRVVDGSQGGTFTVSSLGQSAAATPQVVKVRPSSGDPYYVSFRTATGCDQSMPSSATYLNRTTIHRWSSGNTRYVTSLGDGETFSDARVLQAVEPYSGQCHVPGVDGLCRDAADSHAEPIEPGCGIFAAGDQVVHGHGDEPRQRELQHQHVLARERRARDLDRRDHSGVDVARARRVGHRHRERHGTRRHGRWEL